MAYDVGVRKELVNRGFSDEDIGYDPDSGYVTVKGQNFMKPQKNIEGTTFTDLNTFNNAYNSYDRNMKQQQLTNNVYDRVTNPQQQANPYDQQITDLIGQLTQKMNTPQQINPYATPEYAMYQAQAQQRTDQGIRAAQEALGSAGFGRSTALGQTAQREQNNANQYLETQVIPMILQNQRAQQQQELGNLMNLLNPLMSQQGVMETRNRNQTADMASLLDFITGRQDRETDVRFRDEQAALAQQNIEEERAYRKLRDSEEDRRWLAEYEQRGAQFAEQMGLNWAQLDETRKNRIADEAYRQNVLDAQNDPNSLDNQYKRAQIEALKEKSQDEDEKFIANRDAMLEQLRAGALKPKDAIQMIAEDAQIGYYSPEQAEKLRQMVYVLNPEMAGGGSNGSSNFGQNISNIGGFFGQDIPGPIKGYFKGIGGEIKDMMPSKEFLNKLLGG